MVEDLQFLSDLILLSFALMVLFVSTATGSTGYALAAGGLLLPLGNGLRANRTTYSGSCIPYSFIVWLKLPCPKIGRRHVIATPDGQKQ